MFCNLVPRCIRCVDIYTCRNGRTFATRWLWKCGKSRFLSCPTFHSVLSDFHCFRCLFTRAVSHFFSVLSGLEILIRTSFSVVMGFGSLFNLQSLTFMWYLIIFSFIRALFPFVCMRSKFIFQTFWVLLDLPV